ncbi:uncharacterized protein LOC129744249 [Uranotaenia lowii]|uniref:uncharacterized protein LOC129744249 n=1 Tax=Uranotaenia lowii TaxID=190385 RepID=UPI00247AADE9|nr:uncharacterized protein LOC129744249 [Uranotaenia lowii]
MSRKSIKKAVYRTAFRRNEDFLLAGIPELQPTTSSNFIVKRRRLISVADNAEPTNEAAIAPKPIFVSSDESEGENLRNDSLPESSDSSDCEKSVCIEPPVAIEGQFSVLEKSRRSHESQDKS